ncbi:N(4)-(Beta-N-acetylglucosaminyl)-L-asparaginase isoform X1 [Triplophysa dalaica]|uniref:N(4)-(Beta-N-acetylglucosaminyl)-L-asparaginase isoform X1 n=1 Tax=Triplophysa dalaica TaxID=1582913 RepID=UPI0024E000FA|nr:N(4)-(Beta-N-acetylglucosaminyl)-L-asparaginase isoform X1 [Triplophysa dalaica]
MAAVGTWSFSRPAVERMMSMLLAGQNATDVVETAMSEVEDDVDTGRHIVGRGGYPNFKGVVECDAAIMEGLPGRFGAVAALRGIAQPCRVARKVMDRSPHSLLVGEGAESFAQELGFIPEPNENMLSDHTSTAYQVQSDNTFESCCIFKKFPNTRKNIIYNFYGQILLKTLFCVFLYIFPKEFLEKNKSVVSGHDTLGLIALDLGGNITVGASTSGAPFKSPGRVGDSPLPGCGLYADHTVGAAAATGDGDKIMCYCPSFHVVQLMRQGSSPNEACQAVLADIQRRISGDTCFEVGLIALNIKGEVGAASSVEFPYTFWKQGMGSVEKLVLNQASSDTSKNDLFTH